MHFMIRARAIVVYPGGFGSFDELFEILTLVQTKKINRLPIILIDQEFWEKAINFEFMVEQGCIDPQDRELIHFSETPEDAWKAISSWYELS
jgi:predicted Rossmann-fold nucleotide-binding protein